MNKFFKVIFLIFFFSFYYFEIIGKEDIHYFDFAQDTTIYDSIKSKEYIPSIFSTFKLKDSYSNSFKDFYSSNLFSLSPTSIVNNLKIDTSMIYTFTESIGNISYRPIIGIPFEKYNNYQTKNLVKENWGKKSTELDGENSLEGRRLIPKLFIPQVFDRIFGGNYIDLSVNGFVNLDFGGKLQRIENPSIPIRQQRNGGFNYDQQLNLNILGQIGEKLKISANFDNNNTFDFQNNLKLDYTGYEEEIIKKIEIGNVSMPINNSLLRGAQSLFGIKTELQFGKLFITGILSRQQGKSESVKIENGSEGRNFEILSSNYDENRHFFLGHFFRDNYENWLSSLPQVISGINITRVEVYILNRNNNTETLRNFLALMDLGEGSKIHKPDNLNIGSGIGGPNDNSANELFTSLINNSNLRNIESVNEIMKNDFSLVNSIDFEKVTSARKLSDSEYKINGALGYISLLRKLQNDEVLAVSYEYTYNGKRYQVGELSENYQNRGDDETIILKLLRPSSINTSIPTWKLMMKNIYNLNSNQVNSEGFELRINYRDDANGFDNPSLNEGILTKDKPLVELLGLDRLNSSNDPQKDGNFDYVEGYTIDSNTGTIIFPVLQPFGNNLSYYFEKNNEENLKSKYVFDELYNLTQSDAKKVLSKNKFYIIGKYSSGSSSEISLPGLDIAENSVVVMSGNIQLVEGKDYTVDYNLGKIKIINTGILTSGKDISVSYEKADLFNFQTKWLSGTRMEYKFSDNASLGFTLLHLNERPGGISRYSVGSEPIKNTKYGFDLSVFQESKLLTKIIDFVPLLGTKEISNINLNAEFAQLIPGTSNKVNGEGTTYIDDFENAIVPLSLGSSSQIWKLGTTPITDDNRFDLSNQTTNNLGYSYKRAKIAWYVIDNIFYIKGGFSSSAPRNLTKEDLENNYVKAISPQDIFRQQDKKLINTNLSTFDIAYFPSERGQYNYNPDLYPSGLLKDPKSNFGSITRNISNDVDFDKTNIQYLEFWMMDPFIKGEKGKVIDGIFNKNNETGGDLIFNLGNISEDIMKDEVHAFENGLSKDSNSSNTIENEWGRVTSKQYLTKYFENDNSLRKIQDVGLDGLNDNDEINYFRESFLNNVSLTSESSIKIKEDVSADNFQYYLGDNFDSEDKKIIERYKNYNGMDGNTPLAFEGNFAAQGSPFPENEDINGDNTLSNTEKYYEYKISLEPENLKIGSNHIVDKIVDQSGEATWYQFRIPIRDPDRIQGSISDFKNIRFIRTYLTNWEEPVVLRFSKFQFVGSQWQKYESSLVEKGLNEIPEFSSSNFEVSVVNIEENSIGSEEKSPYVIPPGIKRDIDNTTIVQRRTNEQSLQLCVNDLYDGDARAVFKQVNYDLVNYGRIKMFLHAESSNGDLVYDDEVSAIVRIGSDYKENFYEIEIPLKITQPNLISNQGNISRLVWPEDNELDLSISELFAIKSQRNRLNVDNKIPYSKLSENGKYKISIVGRPNISSVLNIMLGIRNNYSKDRSSKSVCVWYNELRATDFDKKKGWASNVSLNMKLADFADVSGSVRYTSVGFGSIQQRIFERTREENFQYDASANINLDKFLPSKSGIKLPLYISTDKSKITPYYDPLDKDIPLDASLSSFQSENEKKAYKNLVEETRESKSISLNNVRKERMKDSRVDFWDIENISTSFSYSETKNKSINLASSETKQHRGNLTYNYSPKEKNIEPFKKIKWLDSKFLKLIKDFNFNPIPSNFSFSADLNRSYTKDQYRNSELSVENVDPIYEKYFSFNRSYNLRWNLSKSLNIDYNSVTNAVIDEPEGEIDTKEKRDSLWYNLRKLGRTKNFQQNITVSYKLPLEKLPITDWISSQGRMNVKYLWVGGSVAQSDTLGNTINNNRDYLFNGKIDMIKLYNKIPFLKKFNKKSKLILDDSLKTIYDNKFLKTIMKLIMSARSFNINYSINGGTTLAGITNSPNLFGINSKFKSPGWDFVLGSQNSNIRFDASENNWLTESSSLTSPFLQVRSEDITLRGSIQPFDFLRIQLDAKRSFSEKFQEIFRFDDLNKSFVSLTPSRSGDFSISYILIKTAFTKDDDQNNSSIFNTFVNNRKIIRDRLNGINSIGEYGLNSQDVLIPAFVSAYSKSDPLDISLNPFIKSPLPNWRVDFAGLSKVSFLKDIFSSITISHSYQSMYSINNFVSSLYYDENMDFSNNFSNYPLASKQSENGLVPFYVISQVNIVERFSPLLGINVRTKNNLNARIEYRTERNLNLNLSNSQISELKNSDISFDFSFTKSKLKLPFKYRGETIILDNDIKFRMNLVLRDTKTIQRKIEGENILTNGNYNFQLRPNINYSVNNKLNLIMYYENTINKPSVANSFPRYSSSFGVKLRLSLSQ